MRSHHRSGVHRRYGHGRHGTHQTDQRQSTPKKYGCRNFDRCKCSIEDQIYMIYQQSKKDCLIFEQIQRHLLQQFGRANVEMRDIYKVQFLYDIGGKVFKIVLQIDDICPLAFQCTLSRGSCHRIHVIIQEHICSNLYNQCQIYDCCKLHFHQHSKMRDNILAVILHIYKKQYYGDHQQPTGIDNATISLEEFIQTYLQKIGTKPFNEISAIGWMHLVQAYNKFYHESDDTLHNSNWDQLWQVKVLNDYHHESQRNVTFQQREQQIVQATVIRTSITKTYHLRQFCYDRVYRQGCWPCNWSALCQCPLFHIERRSKLISFEEECACQLNQHHRGRPGETACLLFHVTRNQLRERVVSAACNPFLRTEKELVADLSTTPPRALFFNVGHLVQHDRCCKHFIHTLTTKHNPNSNDNVYTSIECKLQIDGCNATDFPLAPLSNLYEYFTESDSDQTGVLIKCTMQAFEKKVLLSYDVRDGQYTLIAQSLRTSLTDKWSFSLFRHCISFNVRYLELSQELIVEVNHVPTFCSIRKIQSWFEDFVVRQHILLCTNDQSIEKLMKVNSASYQFVRTSAGDLSRSVSLTMSTSRGNTNGIKRFCEYIERQQIATVTNTALKTVSRDGSHVQSYRLLNYRGPRIFAELKSRERLVLHYKQRDRIKEHQADHQEQNRLFSPHPRLAPSRQSQLKSSRSNCVIQYQWNGSNAKKNEHHAGRVSDPQTNPSTATQNNVNKQRHSRSFEGKRSGQEGQNDCRRRDETSSRPSKAPPFDGITEEKKQQDLDKIFALKGVTQQHLMARHDVYGNANGSKFGGDNGSISKICRYCFESKWSEEHAFQCLFIPYVVQKQLKRYFYRVEATEYSVNSHRDTA